MTTGSEQEVIVGNNDQLFLVGGNQSVLEYVMGTKPILEGAKKIFASNIRERKSKCKEMGIRYLHLVCPDKHTILSDDFPYQTTLNVSEVFSNYCGDLFCLPTHQLKQLQNEDCAYLRTDTHWSAQAHILIGSIVLDELGYLDNNSRVRIDLMKKSLETERDYCGDLGNKMTPKRKEDRLVLKRSPQLLRFSNGVVGNNGTIVAYLNPAKSGRLLVFGDSFIISCMDVLAEFFGECIVVRTPYIHWEMVQMFTPDAVLTANVERYLPNMPTDAQAPLALVFAQILGRDFRPDMFHFEVLSALLTPGELYRTRTLKRVYDEFSINR